MRTELGAHRRRLSFVVSEQLKIKRAQLYERSGSARFSTPALYDLDKEVAQRLPAMGTFLEIGANDGYSQSNTYYLERILGWRGILIEPVPYLYRMCRRHRTNSTCFHAACVADDSTSIEIVDRTLETVALGLAHREDESRRLAARPGHTTTVPAARLTDLIDRSPLDHITFMSVDVEGAELAVFDGLDWARHAPDWLLVETDQLDEVIAATPGMVLEAQLSFHDYLLRRE
jgi:FkbM family methyltransferase